MRKPFVITVESDVPQPAKASIYAIHRETLRDMKYGDSFFLPTHDKVERLVEYARSIGVVLVASHALHDDIYLRDGWRLWRVPAEQADEPAGKAPAAAEAPAEAKPASPRRKKTAAEQASSPADPPGSPQIEVCETDRYWHASALKLVVRMQAGMPALTAPGHVEISKEEFDRLHAEYHGRPAGQQPPDGLFVGPAYETWWRINKTGRCVEAPFSEHGAYDVRKDVTRISLDDYRQWQKQQEEEL